MMQSLLIQIAPALGVLASGLVTALLALLTQWLNTKIQNDKVKAIVARTTSELSALVAQQAQVLDVARGDDGKLSAEEAFAAKHAVVENFKQLIGPDGIARLMKVLGLDDVGLATWLSARVEEQVRINKPLK